MKYKGIDFDMWDAWYMNANSEIHGFHLKLQPEEWSVGHIKTKDLLHFEKCNDVLFPRDEEKYPDDCLGKYTGCAYYNEKDKKAYLFYTMRNKNASEKIGLAISEDMENYIEYENNPVLELDTNVLLRGTKFGKEDDCRDLIVVFDESAEKYYGYFAAMAEIDGTVKGVIACAVSDDLIKWEKQRIVYVPKYAGVLEVPDVFLLDGKWYLTYLTGNIYGAKGAVDDPNLVKYTLCASADSPFGPFEDLEDNIFLCGAQRSGYTCRSVLYNGKRYSLYVDQSEYGAAISLPKEIRAFQGKLKPCYTELLKKLRTSDAFVPSVNDFEFMSTSFAWNTYGAELCDEGDAIVMQTKDYTYERALIKDKFFSSCELEFTLFGNCRECGIVLECLDKEEKKEIYCIGASFDFSELAVYSDSSIVDGYNIHSKRKFAFEKNKKYHFRIFAMEGQFEVYIDDELCLQGNMLTGEKISLGIFAGCGKAKFEEFKIYELEK